MSSPFQQQFSAKSPLSQDRKIIGEDTFNLVKDENSGNFVSGLSLDGGTSQLEFTNDRLVLTPKQKKNMGGNVFKSGSEEWIEQFHPMTVVKDSVSGGKNYYGLKKPEKTNLWQKVALGLGWSTRDVGLENKTIEKRNKNK